MTRNHEQERSGRGSRRQEQAAGYDDSGLKDRDTAQPRRDEKIDQDRDGVSESGSPRRGAAEQDFGQEQWQQQSTPPHYGETRRPPAPPNENGTSGPAPRHDGQVDDMAKSRSGRSGGDPNE